MYAAAAPSWRTVFSESSFVVVVSVLSALVSALFFFVIAASLTLVFVAVFSFGTL